MKSKILLTIVAFLILLSPAVFADDCVPDKTCAFVQATNLNGGWLNVRKSPSMSGAIIDVIRDSTVLEKNGSDIDGWVPVIFKGTPAFISGTYSKCYPDAPSNYSWTVPSSQRICQSFGVKISYQSCGFHTGLDICATSGSDIVALAAGTVIYVGPLWLDGPGVGRGPYSIVIDHGSGKFSTYGHNSKAIVKIGDKVLSGQKIAEIGSLGYSSGPHLHLEVLEGATWTGNWRAPFLDACSKYKNPMNYK